MIDPAGIPAIPGDMAAVAAHATSMSATGMAFADTGERVHDTWQGLYPHYIAPESGQLLAATGPVASVARSVGEDFTAAGAALSVFAEEVAALQEQMEAIRAQAVAFVAEVADNEDWNSDEGLVERDVALGRAVADTLAAWDAAQARCVNALGALHGAAPVQVDDGDGVLGPGELGYTAEQYQAAAAAGQAPWGTPEEYDRPWYEDVGAFFGGVKDSGVEAAKGLAALGGYDATTGGFSWGTAGTAWQGLGTFALAGAVYATPGGHALDRSGWIPGFDEGELGDTLETAGKAFVAYDQWGTDPARAAGMTTGNLVMAIVGTKGAGGALNTAGGAARTLAPRLGAGLQHAGTAVARLPTVDQLAVRAARRLPGLRLSPVPAVDLPAAGTHHVDATRAALAPAPRPPTGTSIAEGFGARPVTEAPSARSGTSVPPRTPAEPPPPVRGPGGLDDAAPGTGAGRGSGSPVFETERASGLDARPDDAPSGVADRGPASDADNPDPGSPGARPDGAAGSHPGQVPAQDWANLSRAEQLRVAEAEIGNGARTFPNDSDAAQYGGRYWNDYVDNLSPAQKQAMLDYTMEPPHTGPTYREINGYLRGSDPPTPAVLDDIAEIDAAMAGRPVPEDLVVTRGTGLQHLGMPPMDMVGKTLPEHAYMSTSLGGPPGAFGSKEAVLHLRVPRGTPALWMENVSAFGGIERELLLGRGQKYRVNHVVFDQGRWQIFGTVLPR